MDRLVAVPLGDVTLGGDLGLPPRARGVVVLVHGRGSTRASPMHRYVARILRSAGFATLLLDVLTTEEEADPRTSSGPDAALLATRLVEATDWLGGRADTRLLPVGYFAVDAAGTAALVAAAARPHLVRALVACGRWADLARPIRDVNAATLLVVPSADAALVAARHVTAAGSRAGPVVEIVADPVTAAGRTAPERVAGVARRWFDAYLAAPGVRQAG